MQHPDRWNKLRVRYEKNEPRKLLALDGGGIRGLLTLGILENVERIVREHTGKDRLCDYFDYIAGTSTGAIIAAGLARGMPVSELIGFYEKSGSDMFKPSRLRDRLKFFYDADPLKGQLQETFGADTTLEPQFLNCLLLIVTKNLTTDSAWPVSSNPEAKYNEPQRSDCNLKIPLWQLVRASTAAPVYFPHEVVKIDPENPDKRFAFVDGGVTPHNNPAFLLYRMATEPFYRLNFETGEDKLLLISIGTGAAENLGATAVEPNRNLFSTIKELPGDLMYGIQVDQDINCRTVGRCTYGAFLDREIGDLIPRRGGDLNSELIPVSEDCGRKFLYARYNADLSAQGLANLKINNVDPEQIQKMDAVENIPLLRTIGQAAGSHVKPEHFGKFL